LRSEFAQPHSRFFWVTPSFAFAGSVKPMAPEQIGNLLDIHVDYRGEFFSRVFSFARIQLPDISRLPKVRQKPCTRDAEMSAITINLQPSTIRRTHATEY